MNMLKYHRDNWQKVSGETYKRAVHSINHNRSSTNPIDLQEDILESL
jgi:hypothetical protein